MINKAMGKKPSPKRLSTETFIEKSRKRFGDRFTYGKTTYVKKDVEVTVTCKVHGDFVVKPCHFLRSNHGCSRCGPRVDREEFIAKSLAAHGSEYDYSKVIYSNTTTPVEILCRKHGSFWQEPYSHYSKKSRCPKCVRELERLGEEGFIRKSKEVHGDKYDYTKVVYETNVSFVIIGCPKHGEFVQAARSHLAGNGCKKCRIEDSRVGKETFIENARKVHGDKYDYSRVVYKTNKDFVTIICPEHGPYRKKPNQHVSSRSGCPVCAESKGEKRIRVFLEQHSIRYVREFKISPHLYRYDFYLPDFDILIEFNGQQHYYPVEMFGGVEAFRKVVENDKEKRLIAKAKGYPLITLTYKHAGEDMLENMLISSLKRIYHYWFLLDGEVVAFKNFVTVCKEFDLPMDTSTRNIEERAKQKKSGLETLF